ncbi:MAG: 4Fe-4S dicluster domain-containing protein [Firmicutes bacterium]|nr:4Fe-4S dicluster domain-containing protein [Bacillota bacterium]
MNKKKVYMVIDIDRCWGCKACEVACKQEQELETGPFPVKVIEIGPRRIQGSLHRDFVPVMCQHCDKTYCIESCPVSAIYREIDSSIQVKAGNCIGCGSCQSACPYGAVQITEEGIPVKCNLCIERRQNGRAPSCAQHCPGRALKIVEDKYLHGVIGERFYWKTGCIVYVSDKWAGLGEELKADDKS